MVLPRTSGWIFLGITVGIVDGETRGANVKTMDDTQLDEAVAKCLWKRKDGGWFQRRLNGYEWRKELPIEPYSTDNSLAVKLLDSHPDFVARKFNGTYYHVTFHIPSREFIGEGMTLARATALAFIKLHEKENRA